MSHAQRPPEAFRSSDLFEEGLGYVCVSRFKSGGRVELGVFLVDVFCLGVKDAIFRQLPSVADYEEFLGDLFVTGRTEIAPAEARKLIEQVVAYAAKLGLAPAADYKKGARIFGGIHAEDWPGDFTFGKDGKPFFIAGPNDTPARCEQILGALDRSCGPGNYDYLIGGDLDDADLEDEETADDDTRISAELEEIADELRKLDPKNVVITNPPGLPKLSDLLAEVADPLIDETMGIEEVRGILRLTSMAWNYPLLPWYLKLKTKREIKRQAGANLLEVFKMLVDRRRELFPEDHRLVASVEVSESARSEFDIRVTYVLNAEDLPEGVDVPKE